MSNVIPLRTHTSGLLARLKASLAKETAERELRDAAWAKHWSAKRSWEGRQMVAKGTAMIREEEGDNAADEWLTSCMSKGA